MSYYEVIKRTEGLDTDGLFHSISRHEIERALASEVLSQAGFVATLSQEAEKYLELAAAKAREITLKHFGKTIQLYTPIYIANYCDNRCLYCGFKADNAFQRKKLGLDEVKKEAEFISSTGLRSILVLTGDSRSESPVSYIKDCVKILKEYFSSIAIEVYALTEEEYRELISEGVDGLTIYQETYDEKLYETLHPSGPKRDFLFRLDAPERGAMAGMRNVNIGTLLGLASWRREIFLMGLHAKYLQDAYPDVEIGISIPRLRPHAGDFKPGFEVSDRNIVQIITALRLFMPRLGIAVSTREDPILRENIMPLGVTRMSAGSTTCVGGHTRIINDHDRPQFEISDERSVEEIRSLLERRGYQPVLKDWMKI
jgi:2-iminoacetate synthase